MTAQIQHYINGAVVAGGGKRQGDVFNPALGEVCAQVAFADADDVNTAVAAAQAAFPEWAATTPMRRARVLFKFKELMEKNIDKLAEMVTREHGKVFADAQGSVLRGIELTEFMCGIPHLLKGSYSENVGSGIDSYTVRQSLGVCVGVSPFNFPVMVPVWMFIPAIACGNTFVLKPSEKDPSAPMYLAELLHEAGLPAGVFNVLNGDKDAVNPLITHQDVKAVSAVGSTAVAEHIYKTAIDHGKRAHTFGGAKNHCVVMPDADVEQVADAVLGAAYGSAGERCMAVSVVVAVGDEIADQLIDNLKQRVPKLKIGEGMQADMDMGPLISKEHLDKVISFVDAGVAEGAELVVDGREINISSQGYFLGGCLFDKVTADMQIYQQEIFGPVLCVMRVADLDAAIQLASDHEYGNGTAIFTHDGDAARTFANRVQVGMVGVNVPIPVPVAYHSFGGWKRSVFGDTPMHGEQGVQFYTKLKTITQRWPKDIRTQADFIMPNLK